MTSSTSTLDLEAQPDARVAAPAPRSCLRYEASTPLGTWRLRLEFDDARAAACGAMAAAQALLRAEDLLVALDTWCVEAGLDTLPWTWSAADGHADGGEHGRAAHARWHGRVRHAADAGDAADRGDAADHVDAAPAGDAFAPRISLVAPWPALRGLGVPPRGLQAALTWDDAWAVCVLDRFALDADDQARLEPAGAVLIAASLRSPWRGALRAAGEAEDAGLALDLAAAEGGTAIVATPAAAAEAPSSSSSRGTTSPAPNWEIRSLAPLRVPVPVLCGWSPPDAPWPRALFTELELARCGGLQPPRPFMPGSLMPWGRGVAMLLAHG